jgi:hypothetical protein
MIDATLNNQLWEPSVGPKGSAAIVQEKASTKLMRGDFLHLPYLGGTNVTCPFLTLTAELIHFCLFPAKRGDPLQQQCQEPPSDRPSPSL